MLEFTEDEKEALLKLIHTEVVLNEMGAENWDLTEDEEEILWTLITRTTGRK